MEFIFYKRLEIIEKLTGKHGISPHIPAFASIVPNISMLPLLNLVKQYHCYH